ncbi:MAG TPA: DUF2244 domain-containing protein [Janthinobacterium sp.]|nr:DUF2244 domain-containing protein [Janthinobacterium sp.]
MNKQEWLLERNCSLSPRQLAGAYALQCCLSFSIAIALTLQGAWYVLLFSFLEMTALAWAFLYYARHAADHEHLALGDNFLLLERVVGGQAMEHRFDPRRTWVVLPGRKQKLIRLQGPGGYVDIGRFVSETRRQQVARELRERLRPDVFTRQLR